MDALTVLLNHNLSTSNALVTSVALILEDKGEKGMALSDHLYTAAGNMEKLRGSLQELQYASIGAQLDRLDTALHIEAGLEELDLEDSERSGLARIIVTARTLLR
ncbi:hypothetical protein [Vibrio phage V-YDF132]|nr:hypothetical protein [Vibrio phage V-YDF132]